MIETQSTDRGYLTVGIGTFAGCFSALCYDSIAPRVSAKHPTKKPEYLRLPPACVSGLPFFISLMWLGWAAKSDIHWMVPLAALVPYGFAYQLIFVAMINVSLNPAGFERGAKE